MSAKTLLRLIKKMGQIEHMRTSVYGMPYVAGKKKKRVVIGGDLHSGKSTFMALLNDELRSKKLDVELFELDAAAGDVQRFKTGQRMEKQEWTPELAYETNKQFREHSKNNDLTLGDTPGKVSFASRLTTDGAHGAILLVKDDEAKHRWVTFFAQQHIPIIAIINSSLFTNNNDYYNAKTNRGSISGLSRDKYMDKGLDHDHVVIEGVAFEIAQKFGFNYYK